MSRPDPALVSWLMDVGGSVVRWLAATQLGAEDADLVQLERDLMASEPVQTWLARLVMPTEFNAWHSSRAGAFENVAHKLAEQGLRAGMDELDARIAPIRAWLASPPEGQPFSGFQRVLAAAALARLGYEDSAVSKVLQRKLGAMNMLACSGRHRIYVDLADYPDIPKGRRGIPLVDPALTAGPYSQLPSIHAIYGLADWPVEMDTPVNCLKRDAVLRYILHDDYQTLRDGYGLMRNGPRHYYAIGWSVHLPGWPGTAEDRFNAGMAIQRIELMARFCVARESPWFAETLARLDTYRNMDGTYDLPAGYLRETKQGYYVTGAHMGLDAGRRTANLRRIEGTLRMLRLLSMHDRTTSDSDGSTTFV